MDGRLILRGEPDSAGVVVNFVGVNKIHPSFFENEQGFHANIDPIGNCDDMVLSISGKYTTFETVEGPFSLNPLSKTHQIIINHCYGSSMNISDLEIIGEHFIELAAPERSNIERIGKGDFGCG